MGSDSVPFLEKVTCMIHVFNRKSALEKAAKHWHSRIKLDARSYDLMPNGRKPGWIKVDSLENDQDVLKQALTDQTTEFTDVFWICSIPSDVEKYRKICNESWINISSIPLDEAFIESLIIFGAPTGRNKRSIQRKLMRLINSGKKSVIFVTERKSKSKQRLAVSILQQ